MSLNQMSDNCRASLHELLDAQSVQTLHAGVVAGQLTGCCVSPHVLCCHFIQQVAQSPASACYRPQRMHLQVWKDMGCEEVLELEPALQVVHDGACAQHDRVLS